MQEDIYHCETLYQEPNAFDKEKPKTATGLMVKKKINCSIDWTINCTFSIVLAVLISFNLPQSTCKAVYAYTSKSPDELSFPKDAIITNVVKKDVETGWWQGDYGGMSGGWLPCNYVEEVTLCPRFFTLTSNALSLRLFFPDAA